MCFILKREILFFTNRTKRVFGGTPPRTSKKRRNRKMDFHRTRKTKKKQTKHTHRGKTSGRATACAQTKGPPRYRVLKVATCAQRKGPPCTKEGTEVRIPNRGSHVFIILFFDTVRNLFWGVPPPTPATKKATLKVTPRTPLKF